MTGWTTPMTPTTAVTIGGGAGLKIADKAAPTSPTKRIRIKRCKATLRVPLQKPYDHLAAEVVFQCQLEAHGPDQKHYDHGFIEMPNGSGREYEISWRDLGLVTMRRRMKVNA